LKAIRFHGIGDLRIDELPDPEPGPGEVLVAIEAAGMCATDTHILDGHFFAAAPVVLGHEFSGRIVAVGDDVPAARIGELITCEPHEYCRACLYCEIGQEHMCVNKRAYGVHLNGGMADLVVIPARLAYTIPEGVSPIFGAMTEPIACSVHAFDRLAPASGLPIAIHGCGPVGTILIGLAKNSGLTPIIAVDPRLERRDLALRAGADVVLDPTDPAFTDTLMELSRGYGLTYQIDAVGSSRVIETAIRVAARKGTILFFGVAAPEDTATIHPQEVYAKELSLMGTAINPYTHRRAVGLLNRLPLDQLRTASYGIEQAAEAFQAQRDGTADKIFIIPEGSSLRSTVSAAEAVR
jgi:L-iditol 2-dehydrogenase